MDRGVSWAPVHEVVKHQTWLNTQALYENITIKLSIIQYIPVHLSEVFWHFKNSFYENVLVLVAQLCPTLWDPMDCNLPGSSVYRILQARTLKWVVIAPSRGSSQQGSNQGFLHCRQILYCLSHLGNPTLNTFLTGEDFHSDQVLMRSKASRLQCHMFDGWKTFLQTRL